MLDAVQNATVQCGHTAPYYFFGKDPTFMFGCAIPFGINARQQNAWMYHGGGLELYREFLKDYNIISFPAGNTGAQMGGWFRKEIKTVADLKGLKFRIGGTGGLIAGEARRRAAADPGRRHLPGAREGHDRRREWVGPYDDEKLGFYKVAKFYYYPGWWEGGAGISLFVNREQWVALPESYSQVLEAACAEANVIMLAKYDAENPDALRRLVGLGVQLRAFPREIMEASYKQAFALYGETAAANPRFKTVYDAFMSFRDKDTLGSGSPSCRSIISFTRKASSGCEADADRARPPIVITGLVPVTPM